MKSIYRVAACLAALAVPTSALAEPNWVVQPIQTGEQTLRYFKGVPTVGLELNDGVVQVTPMAFDHGNFVFGVAVYNDSFGPANFGIENVAATFGPAPVRIYTKDELVKKAKNRAFWSQFGLALLGGVAAGAAASQRDYYSSTYITPRGTYRSWFSAPSIAGQYQAAAITGATAFGIATIQNQLDRTVALLGDDVLQITTVDPGESYGGQAVIAKISPKSMPARIDLTISWNGESYPFSFQVAKPGTAAPAFTAITRKDDLIDFRVRAANAQAALAAANTIAQQAQLRPAAVEQHPGAAQDYGLNPGGHLRCVTCR